MHGEEWKHSNGVENEQPNPWRQLEQGYLLDADASPGYAKTAYLYPTTTTEGGDRGGPPLDHLSILLHHHHDLLS
jgi:hypothetical protein